MRNPAFLFIVLGLFVLVGLFYLSSPDIQSDRSAHTAQAPQISTPNPSGSDTDQTYRLVVQQGQRISGPAVIRVLEGDEVRLIVTADRPDELHLHGYDLHAHLHPEEPAEISFQADNTGRFEFELHEAGRVLGTIEVMPR